MVTSVGSGAASLCRPKVRLGLFVFFCKQRQFCAQNTETLREIALQEKTKRVIVLLASSLWKLV